MPKLEPTQTEKIQAIKEDLVASKIDDTTLGIEKTIPEQTITETYNRAELEAKRERIQTTKDAYDEARDNELAQLDALLELCDEQGVVAEPIQPEPVDIIKENTNDNIGV